MSSTPSGAHEIRPVVNIIPKSRSVWKDSGGAVRE
jgi:hypothetical protein